MIAMDQSQIYEMLVCLYLSMTRSANYRENQLILQLNRTVATERDALLNLFLMLCPDSISKLMLPRLEKLYSNKLSEYFQEEHKDPRDAFPEPKLDVSLMLSMMTSSVENIPEVLENQIRPLYQGIYLNQEDAFAHFDRAKQAIYQAQEKLFVHKHEN